jgi:hypothetical protein
MLSELLKMLENYKIINGLELWEWCNLFTGL